MSSKISKLSLNQKLTLFLAVLAIIATMIAAFISGHDWFTRNPPPGDSQELEYIGHVMDGTTLQPIANAKITLTLEGVPPVVYTDNEGIYRFHVAIQSELSGQIRIDAQGYQVYIRNIIISPNVDRMDDIRLSPAEIMISGTNSSPDTGASTPTATPARSNAIIVVDNFYRWVNDAQTKDDLKKAWDLETSGPMGLQCREASACRYSKFQDSWWIWKVQYKLYDCGSNQVDAELRYYKRDASIASAPTDPIYVRYQLIVAGGQLKIDKGQNIGNPGVDCRLEVSVP